MRKASFVVLLSLLWWTASLHAQASGQASERQLSTHEQAVVELFGLMDLEKTMIGGVTAMVDAQVASNPQIEPFRGVLIAWATKYLTWEEMAPQMVKIYMEAFTEAETRDMIAFYRSPTGHKALTKLPELFQKGAALGVDIGKAHQSELEEMIRARQAELEREKSEP